MAYKSLTVHPILEFSSPVWDPHVKTLAKQLEAVQNRAARFVSGVYTFSRKSSITSIKQELKWTDLETRRKVASLIHVIFHQSLAGQLAIPVRYAISCPQSSGPPETPIQSSTLHQLPLTGTATRTPSYRTHLSIRTIFHSPLQQSKTKMPSSQQ